MIIDLRSDTLTKPTAAMRQAMIDAEVGDDVFQEDPTVNALQEFGANMFGMEAALYCSSGTQTNQIAISVHTRPGDEVICSSLAHVYLYEGGGIAQNAGASVRLINTERGMFSAADVAANINADDAHYPRTTLVCVENTMNKGGGAIYNLDEIKRISALCNERGLQLHCDGARLFNALQATGTSAKEFGAHMHSISICLSKGLGAPVGSLLLGTKDFIYRAHRRRKNFGGGMRQAGIIAAAGLYALQHNVSRLQEDHARAQALKNILEKCTWVKGFLPVETNIVIIQLNDDLNSADVVNALREQQILCFGFGPDKVRLVTHLDFNDDHLNAFSERVMKIDMHQQVAKIALSGTSRSSY